MFQTVGFFLSQVLQIYPLIAGFLGDLFVYSPSLGTWTDLTTISSGTPPSPRSGHGFASAGNQFYVHGGSGSNGEFIYLDQLIL